MSELVNLFAAILGARVVQGYAVTCDCRMFTTTSRAAFEVAVKRALDNKLWCNACDTDIRAFAVYDHNGVSTNDGRTALSSMVRLDPHNLEPMENSA